MSIPTLSFFTGGGFLDIGFELAGFEAVWTNEIQPAYADMYESGVSSWRLGREEISRNPAKISTRRDIAKLNPNEIMEMAFQSGRPPLFGIVGGSPCPDFSIAGRNAGAEGERGKLTRVFFERIKDIRPTFFVLENVPGLYRHKKHRSFLDTVIKDLTDDIDGYAVTAKTLNALEYGVPQSRERLFVIGFKKSVVGTPVSGDDWYPWPEPCFPGAKHLPWPTKAPFGAHILPPEGVPLSLTVNQLVGDDAKNLPNGNEVFSAHSDKFWRIMEGDVSGKSFKRLHRYRYSPTAWYGNNEVHLHPWEPRRLSVREALRIQTVPDQYMLPPDNSLTDKFKMISNGVPCGLAERVARSVKHFAETRLLVGSE